MSSWATMTLSKRAFLHWVGSLRGPNCSHLHISNTKQHRCLCALFYLHWQRNWRTQRRGHEDGVATGWSRWLEPPPAIQTGLWFRGHCYHQSRLLTSGAEALGGTSCDYASGYPCWARQEASHGFLLSAAECLISAKIQYRISAIPRSHTKRTQCTARINQQGYSWS